MLLDKKRLLLICPDTMGDIVLRQSLGHCIEFSGYELGVVVRQSFQAIARLVFPGAQLFVTDINPHRQTMDANPSGVDCLLNTIHAWAPSVVVSPIKDASWLECVIFRSVGSSRKVALRSLFYDEKREVMAESVFSREITSLASDVIDVNAEGLEGEAYTAIAQCLGIIPTHEALPRPKLTVDAVSGPTAGRAAGLLEELKLTKGEYVICCAVGAMNTALKAWPEASLIEFINYLKRKHNLPTLLAGVPDESERLGRIANATSSPVHIGTLDGIHDLIVLLRNSRAYVGTDSGPMHLAAALGLPVFALFGGGTWGRFHPQAFRSCIVTHWLPCFHCRWDCLFSEPHCITAVPQSDLEAGVDWLLENNEPGLNIIGQSSSLKKNCTYDFLLNRSVVKLRETIINFRQNSSLSLKATLADTEIDRDYWKGETERIAPRIDELQSLVHATEQNRDYWKSETERIAPRIDTLQSLIHATEQDRAAWRFQIESLSADAKLLNELRALPLYKLIWRRLCQKF